jgi:hypothetical protein
MHKVPLQALRNVVVRAQKAAVVAAPCAPCLRPRRQTTGSPPSAMKASVGTKPFVHRTIGRPKNPGRAIFNVVGVICPTPLSGGAITPSPPPPPVSDGPGSYYYQKSCYTTSQIELLLYSIQRLTAGKFPSSSKHRKRSVSNPSLSRALSTSLDHNFLVYYPISSSLDIDSRYQGIFFSVMDSLTFMFLV